MRTSFLLTTVLLACGAPAIAQGTVRVIEMARPRAVRATTLPLTLVGVVLDAFGRPAEGALVTSGAGGTASADLTGRFVLDVEVPLDAETVTLLARGRSGRGASAGASVSVPASGGPVGVDVIQLGLGAECEPAWLSTFDGATAPSTVHALATFDDGGGPALYAGGPGVLRWDGAAWQEVELSPNGVVYALVVHDDGGGEALYAGGFFTHAGGKLVNRIARWDGVEWSALGGGANSVVYSLVEHDDGSGPALYAAGFFSSAGGVDARRVGRWDGVGWSPLDGGLAGGPAGALAVYDAGAGAELFATGSFTSAGGASANGIARWNGTSWSSVGGGLNAAGQALAVYDAGSGPRLYVGGTFTVAGGVAASRIAAWDGTSWSSVGGGMNHHVQALAVFDSGGGARLHVGGRFTVAGGQAAQRVASWDGAQWAPMGGGVDDEVRALLAGEDDGNPVLYAGGAFSLAFDSGDAHVAAWGCDVTPPVVETPSSVTAYTRPGTTAGAIVTFTVVAFDNADPSPTVFCTPPSGSVFPLGTTMVSCTAFDAAGNQSAMQTFPVVVREKRQAVGF